MIRIASFNVENLFQRAKAMNGDTYAEGRPILSAYKEVNELFMEPTYTPAIKDRILELLVQLDIYFVNGEGAIRRRITKSPKWAWMRKNRGDFDREPQNTSQNVEITATGRDSWIGWVELEKEPVDELATRMTAKVIQEVDADIIGVVEAEDRPSMVRFNESLIGDHYAHVMLVDGNDDRGIDVAIMTKADFSIKGILSNVDNVAPNGKRVFDRDCPQYEIETPSGATVHVLLNHFKSQSGGGGPERLIQATEVRAIVTGLVADGKHCVVMGDLNEGPKAGATFADNLAPLFTLPELVDCYSIPGFDFGGKQGTFDSCGLGNRLDYILISQSLRLSFSSGRVFRKGLWGSRTTRPTAWETYPEMTKSSEQASDHSAIVIELDI
jgi:endonuclease/exonuclease/phosphatase family metal-dependent hydrolase